ncbi:MAG: indole-3-glycerol phosphate synthase TrpC [Acidobacteria bacterium]|nr:indole-3-glycerol phosphate synthase TrpC [Acidobacteriota bacterium]
MILDDIVASTRRRIAPLQKQRTELRRAALDAEPARSLSDALTCLGLQVIAEIKRRSPSAGQLDVDLVPQDLATIYVAGGAAAISVLTEPEYFGGSADDLVDVRSVVDVPILRKDFIVDSAQIYEAKILGADAVLLIVAILDDEVLGALHDAAASVGLEVLVEAHSEEEALRAVAMGAKIVGINNRDLTTFATDLSTGEQIVPIIRDASVTVGESGVSNLEGASRMAVAGFDAILVGEALVRSDDPAALITTLGSV